MQKINKSLKDTIKIINAFVHDFTSGLWLASVLVIYWINKYSTPEETEILILRLKRNFFYIGIGSLIVIILTGFIRMFTYTTGKFGEHAEKKRRMILIIKHIIGFIIYGTGTYWIYVMVYR
jgi:putative copper export protein